MMSLPGVCARIPIDSRDNVYVKVFLSINNTVNITRNGGIFVPDT